MPAFLMNMASVAPVRELPFFNPQAAAVGGDAEDGGFQEHLAQALAKLLGRPDSTDLDENGLPPALGALRRALEQAGRAAGAHLERALRPLLDKILAADGYSQPERDEILERSQAADSRIDLTTLFELAAALLPPSAAAQADAACLEGEVSSQIESQKTAAPKMPLEMMKGAAEAAWQQALAQPETPEPSLPQAESQPETASKLAKVPLPPAAAAAAGNGKAGLTPEAAPKVENVATALAAVGEPAIPAEPSEAAGQGRPAQAIDAPQVGPAAQAEAAQSAARPREQASVNAAALRPEASPPGIEVARAIQEILSATLPRAVNPERRGRVHVEVSPGGVKPASNGEGTPPAAGKVQPLLQPGAQAPQAGAEPAPEAVLEPPADQVAAKQLAPGLEGGRRRQPARVDPGPTGIGLSDRLVEPTREALRAAPAPELVQQVAQQVERAITAGLGRGEDRLRIRLKPPELGELHLNLSLRGEHLKVVLVAESQTARDTLQAAVGELRGSLAEQGLRLEQFSVFIRHEGGSPYGFLGHGENPGAVAAAQAGFQPAEAAPEGQARPPAGRVDIFC